MLAKLAGASVDCFGQGCTWAVAGSAAAGSTISIGIPFCLTCYLHLTSGCHFRFDEATEEEWGGPHSLTFYTDDHIWLRSDSCRSSVASCWVLGLISLLVSFFFIFHVSLFFPSSPFSQAPSIPVRGHSFRQLRPQPGLAEQRHVTHDRPRGCLVVLI